MKKLGLIYIFPLLWSLQLSAQSDLILYNFDAIPQSLHSNPAMPQQTKVWVGLPALSGVYGSYHNSGFKLIDLFAAETDINANVDQVIMNLDGNSQLSLRQELDLLGIGFKLGNGFVVMGGQQVYDFKMDYPGDLLKLIRFGNGHKDYGSASLSQFDMESINRTNYYLGYQHKFLNDRLSLGFRLKYIMGLQHVYAERTEASIATQDDSKLVLETDVLIRTAGVANLMGEEEDIDIKSVVLPKNNGLGADFGAVYKASEHWTFSASVLDLGYINWTGNTRQYESKGRFEFDGIEADLSNEKPVESFEDIADSLADAFQLEEVDGESYTRSLASRVFVGANYNFNEKHSLGALYHARVWQGAVFHDISANYRARLARGFQYSINYSLINGTYNNVGAGLALKLGPFQLYALCDNVLHSVMLENLQSTSVRVGLNFSFYGKKDRKAKSSAPEIVPPADDNNDNN